jgi:hypothetical protein
MSTKITINSELVDLTGLAGDFANDCVAKAMERPLKIIADRAKAYAPTGKGNLRNSIGYKVDLNNLPKGIIVGIIGPRRRAPGRPTKYAPENA